jgi:predicted porin
MKRSVVVCAFALIAGAAGAQSSVTVFGVVDAAVQRVSGEGNGSITRLVSGSNLASRLGVRGTEDLGGGMYASFWLESGINADNGSFQTTNTNNQTNGLAGGGGLVFNRRSTLSLGGGWGELRLGRDFSPAYLPWVAYDPFANLGVGNNSALLGGLAASKGIQTFVRVSNAIQYFLPSKLGGFYGSVMYGMGENPSNAAGGTSNDGRVFGGRAGYANGPLDVSIAYARTSLAAGDYVQENIGGAYNFGVVKLVAGYYRDEVHAAAIARANSWNAGVLVPVGNGTFKASYTTTNQNSAAGNNDASMFAIGYVYDLSKRTALYAAASRINNRASSVLYSQGRAPLTPGGKASGYEFGVRHSF